MKRASFWWSTGREDQEKPVAVSSRPLNERERGRRRRSLAGAEAVAIAAVDGELEAVLWRVADATFVALCVALLLGGLGPRIKEIPGPRR